MVTTVWNAIKTVITTVVTAIQTFLTTAWNAIKTVITTVVNAIKTVIVTVWNVIKTAVTTVVNAIKTVISTVWNSIKNTVTSIVNGIKNTVTSVFQNILSGIKGTMGNIVTTIKDGFNQAISFITSLPPKALQWGKDIIMGIVNGIRSCIGAVGDAVASVAEKIKSFLHFSVPDEGPLTEYESWMPDFMKGLAKGIEGSRGLIEKAVRGVSEDMVISPRVASGMADAENSAAAVTGNSLAGLASAITAAIRDMNGQTGDIVIPVYLGGAMLDEIVVSAQQRTNLRSGGR